MNILGILLLATLVEGFVEYAFGKVEQLKSALVYISLGLGVAASIAYKVDILASFGLVATPVVGYVVSGLIIGRGANYVNDIISAIRGTAHPSVMVNPIVNQPNITTSPDAPPLA